MTPSGQAKLAGVMGWPVSHSLSPRLHNYWLREYGIDGVYVPLPVAPENLKHALRALPKLGFQGVNLTVPHKVTVLPHLDTVTDIASRIGAVNTVFVGDDGALAGTNTDASGFLENLKSNASSWQGSNRLAVVLGSGGAARAVIAALLDDKVSEIRLLNRTIENAQALADVFGASVKVIDWNDRNAALNDAALLVNTTVLGMDKQPPLDISLDALPDDAVVYDLVYAPLQTPLLARAQARGIKTVDGLGMLLYQAVPGFEGWFGIKPQVTDGLRQAVLAEA